jgi:hypothetical protein
MKKYARIIVSAPACLPVSWHHSKILRLPIQPADLKNLKSSTAQRLIHIPSILTVESAALVGCSASHLTNSECVNYNY